MEYLPEITDAEREILVGIARRETLSASLDELLSSPLLTAGAAYLAVEETWASEDEARVLDAVEGHLKSADKFAMAALTSRGATLDTWWIRGAESKNSWDRAMRWAQMSTAAKPEWLSGWLILYSGYQFWGQLELAASAAKQAMALTDPSPIEDELEWAIETLFGGRIGWRSSEAQYMLDALG